MSAPTYLPISTELVDMLIVQAHEARLRGEEAVGLVTAPTQEYHDARQWSCWPLRNESPEPERTFYVSQGALVAEWSAATLAGHGVMAFYHSHLRRAADPSETDIAQAWCARQFIVFDGARHRDSMVKFWWIEDGAAVQVPLVEVG